MEINYKGQWGYRVYHWYATNDRFSIPYLWAAVRDIAKELLKSKEMSACRARSIVQQAILDWATNGTTRTYEAAPVTSSFGLAQRMKKPTGSETRAACQTAHVAGLPWAYLYRACPVRRWQGICIGSTRSISRSEARKPLFSTLQPDFRAFGPRATPTTRPAPYRRLFRPGTLSGLGHLHRLLYVLLAQV